MSSEVGMYMAYWYSSLFVVCEGWQELNLADREVDQLLASENLGTLKRFRHGAFHFQKDYFDPRFMDFIDNDLSVDWVTALDAALSDWFLSWLRAKKKPSSNSSESEA